MAINDEEQMTPVAGPVPSLRGPIDAMSEYPYLQSLVSPGGPQIIARGPMPIQVPRTDSEMSFSVPATSESSMEAILNSIGLGEQGGVPSTEAGSEGEGVASRSLAGERLAQAIMEESLLAKEQNQLMQEASAPIAATPSIETAIARVLAAGLGTALGGAIGGWSGAGGAAKAELEFLEELGKQDLEVGKAAQREKLAAAKLIESQRKPLLQEIAKIRMMPIELEQEEGKAEIQARKEVATARAKGPYELEQAKQKAIIREKAKIWGAKERSRLGLGDEKISPLDIEFSPEVSKRYGEMFEGMTGIEKGWQPKTAREAMLKTRIVAAKDVQNRFTQRLNIASGTILADTVRRYKRTIIPGFVRDPAAGEPSPEDIEEVKGVAIAAGAMNDTIDKALGLIKKAGTYELPWSPEAASVQREMQVIGKKITLMLAQANKGTLGKLNAQELKMLDDLSVEMGKLSNVFKYNKPIVKRLVEMKKETTRQVHNIAKTRGYIPVEGILSSAAQMKVHEAQQDREVEDLKKIFSQDAPKLLQELETYTAEESEAARRILEEKERGQ